MESHSLLRRTINNPRVREGDFFNTSQLYSSVDPTCIKVVAHNESVPLVQVYKKNIFFKYFRINLFI